MAFRRSGKPAAQHRRILRDTTPTRPSRFQGAHRKDGWVLYRWETEFGAAVLAYTVGGEMGTTFPSHALLGELADNAAVLAVVAPDYNVPHGPSLEAIDAAGPDEYYATTWRRLEQLLGMPAPYWHSNLRDPALMTAWRPGAATLTVPAVVIPDPAPLLRLAAEEPDGSHAAVATLTLAREAMWDCAQTALREITEHVDSSDGIASIAIAARPLVPAEPPVVAEEILRDGWRSILNRTDVLAAECARVGSIMGPGRYFPGSCKVTVDPAFCAQAAQWAARLQPSPRTALAIDLGDDQEHTILVDPATDMPAVRTDEGMIETIAPQRLPTLSPLAALTIAHRSVWVTCEDDTVFLAPQIGPSYTYGYEGGGPVALARLIGLLLDDITHTAPGFDATRPDAGLSHAVEEDWKSRSSPFTLTRTELEVLCNG
ncbi:hypothetical protein [Streptomyces sp. NPDC024089]|uniref:hypothetical protein n=1 Tax=Streptomyces sp. NPDC024089 TaxID=3154328 RepID=UPI00340E7258